MLPFGNDDTFNVLGARVSGAFFIKNGLNRTIGKTMCLGIDVLKSEEEVFDIGYASQLSTEVLDFAVE